MGKAVTVTLLVPVVVPLVAVTVPVAGKLGAVSRPVVIVPTVVDQLNSGWLARELPNWSTAEAVNDSVVVTSRVTTGGLTLMPVSVWFTVTATLLVLVSPSGSVIVTWKL